MRALTTQGSLLPSISFRAEVTDKVRVWLGVWSYIGSRGYIVFDPFRFLNYVLHCILGNITHYIHIRYIECIHVIFVGFER